jgi:hypothetical protein
MFELRLTQFIYVCRIFFMAGPKKKRGAPGPIEEHKDAHLDAWITWQAGFDLLVKKDTTDAVFDKLAETNQLDMSAKAPATRLKRRIRTTRAVIAADKRKRTADEAALETDDASAAAGPSQTHCGCHNVFTAAVMFNYG